jgi:hypothetical protein
VGRAAKAAVVERAEIANATVANGGLGTDLPKQWLSSSELGANGPDRTLASWAVLR